MQQTHLEMVQNILSALGGDEVNSYSDTAESRQVSNIIRNTYYNIFQRANFPKHLGQFQLTASGDNAKPALMTKPSTVARIDWIKYDKSVDNIGEPAFQYVTILPFQQFTDMIYALNDDATNVIEQTVDSQTYLYRNDKHPDYCTVLKNQHIIFDSCYVAKETTLQAVNSLCFGQIIPTYTLADATVPDLDEKHSILLFHEAKATAFAEMLQTPNERAERDARRSWTSVQKEKDLSPPSQFDRLPYYGRK